MYTMSINHIANMNELSHTHMNESCHTYHLCHIDNPESSGILEEHSWMSHFKSINLVANMNKLSHTYMNESCHTYQQCHVDEPQSNDIFWNIREWVTSNQ